jgi:hypothetical protein
MNHRSTCIVQRKNVLAITVQLITTKYAHLAELYCTNITDIIYIFTPCGCSSSRILYKTRCYNYNNHVDLTTIINPACSLVFSLDFSAGT